MTRAVASLSYEPLDLPQPNPKKFNTLCCPDKIAAARDASAMCGGLRP